MTEPSGIHITDRTLPDVAAFCNLLALSRGPTAHPNLREISVILAKDISDRHNSQFILLSKILAGVIARGTRLETLRLSPAEAILSQDLPDQTLRNQIHALSNLKVLALRDAASEAGALLTGLRCRLTDLALGNTEETAGQDIAPYLTNLCNSLVTLQLFRTNLWHISNIFRRLKRLILEDTHVQDIKPLITAFPELLEFKFLAVRGGVIASRDQLEDVRTQNRAQQVQPSASSGDQYTVVGYTWPSLEHVQGDIDGLYMLGIRCPIRHLYIHPLVSVNQNKFRALMDDGIPEYVSLDILLRDYYVHRLVDLFPAHVFLPARLRLRFWFRDYTRSVPEVLNCILRLLERLPTADIVIQFKEIQAHMKYFTSMDVESFADRVWASCRAVQFLCVNLGQVPFYWGNTASKADYKRIPQRISNALGEQVLHGKGLDRAGVDYNV
ncbi:hypothetical protein CERSUDRAFT_92555 [Gelatoporia subvermispora B]|uniref:F-box domain-containing protein n=1 Tax=Ceriporiopsis subvermispora (strain B) TaxID=914234 RepID=M2RMI6_CERS8|nr:hypothetical protein CERSUDRAFT_92555 [Gelatoporia subvermispora B]